MTLAFWAACSREPTDQVQQLEEAHQHEPVAEVIDAIETNVTLEVYQGASADLPIVDPLESVEQAIVHYEVDDAQELLEPLLESGEEPIRVGLMQSEIFLEKEDYPSAIHATDVVLELDPRNAAAYYQRAQARIGIEEYAEAIADITRFIELTPSGDLRYHAQAQLELWNSILYSKQ